MGIGSVVYRKWDQEMLKISFPLIRAKHFYEDIDLDIFAEKCGWLYSSKIPRRRRSVFLGGENMSFSLSYKIFVVILRLC